MTIPLPEPVNFSDVWLPGKDEFNRQHAVWGHTADQLRARDAQWRAIVAAEVARERERIAVLEHLVIDAAYTLDKARIWNGMGWTYNPLHPVHYAPMRERLHNECDSIEAARAALEATK